MEEGKKVKIASWILIFFSLAVVLLFAFKVDFLSKDIIRGVDGYYHINISRLIAEKGAKYKFPWVKFSTLNKAYADRSFLFHFFPAVLFRLFPQNTHTSLIAKAHFALFFYQIVFLLGLIFILRQALPLYLIPIFIFLPFSSNYFIFYFFYLRPATFAYLIMFLGLFFLVRKNYIGAFIAAFIYPLVHMSFFLILIFAILVEVVRYLSRKEFFLRNISAVLLGLSFGLFLHPNFPANILSFYLNVILMPLKLLKKELVTYGSEMNPILCRQMLSRNLIIILTLALALSHSFLKNFKKSLAMQVHLVVFLFFFIFSLVSTRFSYQAVVFCVVFLAFYLGDYLKTSQKKDTLRRARVVLAGLALFLVFAFNYNYKDLKGWLLFHQSHSRHFERMAGWIKKKIPPHSLIFHSGFSDAEVFITLLPQYYYLNISDSIYMYYWGKDIYKVYADIQLAKLKDPAFIIKKVFSTKYGYVSKDFPFYYQVKRDKKHFKILAAEPLGLLFQIKNTDLKAEKEH